MTAPRTRALQELTWPEVGAAVADGWDIVVVGAGSIEQHGPHLLLATDTLIGEGLVAATVTRLDRALTQNGILGDARGADAERGRACLDALVDYLAGWVRWERAAL